MVKQYVQCEQSAKGMAEERTSRDVDRCTPRHSRRELLDQELVEAFRTARVVDGRAWKLAPLLECRQEFRSYGVRDEIPHSKTRDGLEVVVGVTDPDHDCRRQVAELAHVDLVRKRPERDR